MVQALISGAGVLGGQGQDRHGRLCWGLLARGCGQRDQVGALTSLKRQHLAGI